MKKTSPHQVSVKQIQKLDHIAIHDYGVPSLALMENAGCGVAREIIRRVKKKKNPSVCVVCGSGNNGGDGFVVARHLINAGVQTKIFLIGRREQLKPDAAVNYHILTKLRYPIEKIKLLTKSSVRILAKADIVVDAIFGVGITREIENPYRDIIQAINRYAKYIVSIDIPSGLDGTTGNIYGVCVKANRTMTFSFAKKGFFKKQGPCYAGKIVVIDIGIPEKLKRRIVK